MPKYTYMCKNCLYEFEIRHGIKEKLYDCENCDNKGTLERIPQLTNIVKTGQVGKQKAGSVVKEFIDANKEVLNQEKKKRYTYDD